MRRDFVPEADTPWREIESRNLATLHLLDETGALGKAFTERDGGIILDEWTFPLHHEDLSMIEIDPR